MIHRDHTGQSVVAPDIVHMPFQVRQPGGQRVEIFASDVGEFAAAVKFQRTQRRDDHGRGGHQSGFAAFDVDEFLGPEVRAEAGLGDHVVRQFEGGARRHHRIAAMRDVRERTAVHEGGIVFQGLHQVGPQCIAQQHRHRAVRLQFAGTHRSAIMGVADDDVAQPLLEIPEVGRQADDGHDLGGRDDVEAVAARRLAAGAAHGIGDAAQCPVIHVHHALPGDVRRIDAERVAVVDVVVDQCGE